MAPSTNPISKSSVVVYPKKSLSVLMTQSTIYRQHEARLARSNRLKDDPRPPLVRVLSLLPGLHILVPRYEPPPPSTTSDPASTTSLSLGAMYSEETKFIKDDNDTLSTTCTTQQQQQQQGMVFPAMLATSLSSAMGHAMFGKRQPLVLSTNPFQTNLPTLSYHTWMRSSSGSSGSRRCLTTPLPIVMASTATLFGTRVYLEELEISEANHFFTAAMAGVASGVMTLLLVSMGGSSSIGSAGGNAGITTRLLSSPRYMGSHLIGGMAYFGSYDYIKNTMQGSDKNDTSNNNSNSNSTPTTLWPSALAGAVAGSLQAALVTRLPMACLRAAPMHAMIWCAYESATTTTNTRTTTTTTSKPCPSQV